MKDCDHKNTHKRKISREIQGHTFSAQTRVCKNCGAELWGPRVSEKFNEWIRELEYKPRIQFNMSDKAEQCLDEHMKKYPKVPKTIVVRIFISIYLKLLKDGTRNNEIFNDLMASEYYQSFETDKGRNFPVDVSIPLFLDVQAFAHLFNMKTNQAASEAFHVMMALCLSHDKNLKEFWEKIVVPQFEDYLKVAA